MMFGYHSASFKSSVEHCLEHRDFGVYIFTLISLRAFEGYRDGVRAGIVKVATIDVAADYIYIGHGFFPLAGAKCPKIEWGAGFRVDDEFPFFENRGIVKEVFQSRSETALID